MTLNNLNKEIPVESRNEEAIMLYYTGADVQRLTRCVITGAQWIKIMAAIEASDFYESIYERIKQIAEDALEGESNG